jgi:uncharacterized protein YcgI (DUF1989 family)
MSGPAYDGATFDRVMEPKSYLTVEMKKGEVLRVEDLDGRQCADIAFFNLAHYRQKRKELTGSIPQSMIEHYSQGMTCNRNRHVYLGKGFALYTNLCTPIMNIVEDTVGHHDVIVAWCNPELNYSRWGDVAVGKLTCKENIRDAMAPYGVQVELPCTFNIFMDYSIGADGVITYKETLSGAGDYIDLKAEMDVIVAISNCPQELSIVNGSGPTRLRLAVFEEATYRDANPGAAMEANVVDSTAYLAPPFKR